MSIDKIAVHLLPDQLRLEWAMKVKEGKWLLPSHYYNKTLEVRLYVDPMPLLEKPELQNTELANTESSRETSGAFTLQFFSVGTAKSTSKPAFRSGMTTLDQIGLFYPVELDLWQIAIPDGGIYGYPIVTWSCSDPEWRNKSIKIRVLFGFQTAQGFDLIAESKISEFAPQSPRSRENGQNVLSNAPTAPTLFVGREKDIQSIKHTLLFQPELQHVNKMIIQGWPGVGKTTLITTLANDTEVVKAFPGGILWAYVGERPNHLKLLCDWGRLLGIPGILDVQNEQEARNLVKEELSRKRALLIIDDVWDANAALPLFVGGLSCFTIVTTRFNKILNELTLRREESYKLDLLDLDQALALFSLLAPQFSHALPEEVRNWIVDIERLPLSILVGAKFLENQIIYFGPDIAREELAQLNLLRQQAPADRYDPERGGVPTIEVIVRQSTNKLDPQTRCQFAILGLFAPKPATFDLGAMADVWGIERPHPIAMKLIDFGLLEPKHQQYQMHALLVELAQVLLVECEKAGLLL